MWSVEFYQDQNEQKPVRDFLLSLRPKPRGKVLQGIQILSEFGIDLPFPYSSQVDGRLRELRVREGKNQYRILYYGDMAMRIGFLFCYTPLQSAARDFRKEKFGSRWNE